ncbi:hypothetical protein [Variovorax sp. E3]|uniref:hypothetical protein n=1 Tax=Variovorax sp. E3 TaxID=1914993 RepID=UPI0018DE8891|nr:hypothetical protein [Variovorax sp. E3]
MAAAVVAAFVAGAAHASNAELGSLSNTELLKRWNAQADWYDKAYLLESCADKKVPSSNRSFLLCDTAGGKGTVAFRRNSGRLENVEYTMKGHPLSDASMFVRFVRSSRSGDMAAVGASLLKTAQKNGSACTSEPSAQVCANFSSGAFFMSALEPQRP